jgi:hypothetical protein
LTSVSWEQSYLGQLRALAGDRTLMFVGARAVVRDDTYQLFVTAFRIDVWDGELVTVTEETTDAAFYPDGEFPMPLSSTVAETLHDLEFFERTGQTVLK